ncbi:hypothetical protein HanRHA438_Chr05g0214141 [Helianthus annuus]|uniref:Uncharacterized protein n=1 Tax=Helianthus annuus TaxID=4232 RepID=A0A9K3NMD1_HELAN|nr:hypothetical protein HanXRQr2_Chr05g0204301 [Helianthus annuus]KAJ0918134.1 hypothetical protein HanRHA438_Chr05g0214141 [Helianthus annuus]KAJ0921891.1 hypothetical protein HanPSC8_Chr05g0197031 [Helianthus annuus]
MADFSNSSSIATYLSLLNVCAKFDYHTNCIRKFTTVLNYVRAKFDYHTNCIRKFTTVFFLTGASMGLFKCFTV